ncbi:hypothetical protein GQ42DRAFT_154831 [Ramicandelaber brevisporus]|nr:hypothetical protein GQ42DRAFT_154831 [Ramicandelaber brevisporus]
MWKLFGLDIQSLISTLGNSDEVLTSPVFPLNQIASASLHDILYLFGVKTEHLLPKVGVDPMDTDSRVSLNDVIRAGNATPYQSIASSSIRAEAIDAKIRGKRASSSIKTKEAVARTLPTLNSAGTLTDTDPSTTDKKRRLPKPWTLEESNALIDGIAKHGCCWKNIREDSNFEIHPRRTTVDLKDRGRTILRNKDLRERYSKTNPSVYRAICEYWKVRDGSELKTSACKKKRSFTDESIPQREIKKLRK